MPDLKPIVNNRYYPRLSEIMSVDDLPEFLHFAESGLDGLLDSIHYKNLQYSKSHRGDTAFYSLDVITKNLGLNLPFGLRLVLNPEDEGDSLISSFPVSIQYEWQILAFLKSFNLQNFSFSPEGLYELGLQIFRVSPEQVIANVLNLFIKKSNTSVSNFQQLVNDINTIYPSAGLSLPAGQEPTVQSVATSISQNPNLPQSISEVMFAVYIFDGNLDETKRKLQQFYKLIVPNGIEDYIKKLITPKVKASLTLSAGIEFPLNVLQPVNLDGTVIPNKKTIFKFAEASFYFDTEAGIGSQLELAGSLIPEYSQIGNTGLIIGFTNAKLDLSRTTNIPEADAAGYPVDFVGLYVQEAFIEFTKFGNDDTSKTSASLRADNLLIGTGGVSGKITLESNGVLYRKFDNFSVELDKFSMTFRQGAIVDTEISGKLKLNKFGKAGNPAEIGIQVSIADNGDFSITALPSPDLITLSIPEVFDFHVHSLAIGKKARGYYLDVAGQLDFTANVPLLGEVLPTGIDIKKLLIWSDGGIEFEGGGLVIPKSFRLSVGPVKLEVSNLTLGAHNAPYKEHDRNYQFFGFDGMINAGSAGFKASGNGIKYYYTTDDGPGLEFHQYLSIDGIAIDLTIPGTATKDSAAFILKGFLGMHNPNIPGSDASTEYTGAVTVTMPKFKIGGSAGMKLQPSVPAFLVDLGLELSIPIPLASTGLGIYGFRGLFGKHYLPAKEAANTHPPLTEDSDWWEYYKAPSIITGHEGIEVDKFASRSGYSIGAGVSFATAFDSGLIFSSKLFVVLGLSDCFLIQGQAAILSSRIGLNDPNDPPFSAFIAIDGKSFQAKFSVDYDVPSGGSYNGDILGIHGYLEMAFYFNDSSRWYINAGRDLPESQRIQAKILSLFQGYAYLMLSSSGIKAGAGAKFDFSRKFGPASFGIGAYLDLSGFLSFKPIQVGGRIDFGGYAYLKVFCVKLGLSVSVYLAVEAPHPFNITGGLEVKVHIIFKTIKVKVDISWHFNKDKNPLLAPIPVLQLPDTAKGYLPAVATSILSNETFTVNYVTIENSPVIPAPGDSSWFYDYKIADQANIVTVPMDSFIDINLLKPVIPQDNLLDLSNVPKIPDRAALLPLGGALNQLPDGYIEWLPPQKGVDDQVKHQFELSNVEIFAWSGADLTSGQWMPYNIYEAVTAIVESNTGPDPVDLAALKPGYWQYQEPNKYNKIRLLSQNMFSYLSGTDTATSDLDGHSFPRKAIFCYDDIIGDQVVSWKDEITGTVFGPGEPFYQQGLTFTLFNLNGSVADNSYLPGRGLRSKGKWGTLQIRFPQPVSQVKLDLGANQNALSIDFNKRTYTRWIFGLVLPNDVTQQNFRVSRDQQGASVSYDDVDKPIDSIRISLNQAAPMDYTGDLVAGGYFRLPDQFLTGTDPGNSHDTEAGKSLMFLTLYNRSFTAGEVLAKDYAPQTGMAGQWPMDSPADKTGNRDGIVNGILETVPGFYGTAESGIEALKNIYAFQDKFDALIIPFAPVLQVENGSFAFEVTAVFGPFTVGISTLLYKVQEDAETGFKKGFALHLVQNTPGTPAAVYTDLAAVPQYSVWLTCYHELEAWGIEVKGQYTVNCLSSGLEAVQYKNIFVSVNRETAKLDVYLDKIAAASVDIPAELAVFSDLDTSTDLNQITYKTHSLHRRYVDNPITGEHVIREVQILSDGLNRLVQPVWRPNTTFAVRIKTRDRVNGNIPAGSEKTHIFGFKTVGPVGFFHKTSPQYKLLKDADRQEEFKLANLKAYIDYERSFPDAQSRYNLSKPVFCHDPQVKLFFTQPYINAMFANWEVYQGMPKVEIELKLYLIDPAGHALSPNLVSAPVQETPITLENYKILPEDQQVLYLLNAIAELESCHRMPSPVTRRLQQEQYKFDDLQPGQLYNALFKASLNAVESEVHKFAFITSRFHTFQEQAGSFILDAAATPPAYACYSLGLIFSDAEIEQRLKKLINDDATDDPDDVLRYATKFDRLIFGGLDIKTWEPVEHSVITVFVNTNPANGVRRILGILVRNPEPFNDPRLPPELLQDSIGLELTTGGTVTAASGFIYVHAGDTSAVFITNAGMDIAAGEMKLSFRQKIFNGSDYSTLHEDYEGPSVSLAPFIA
ncbi:hypothetical protein PQ469_14350 [Mucilaginibacter sp. KACC 22773]|uniref:hypothetical protein n=1 Tax=Mucilaginibacter sp. KACC 22773 TaxID=3025671 RepID=UPI002366A4A9|nr:hypothetical protein [Mucilaginibacter sp. KACC 22773]WDF81189.1 hypothetical protein PQ469_14350 [Mucilaginibacter sp. KACC 22773]